MTDHLDLIRSAYSGMIWPAVPPDPGALALAMQFQLSRSQWQPAAALRPDQFRQLGRLLDHAHDSVPFYRERLAAARYRPGAAVTDDWFAALPVLTRTDVLTQGEALHSRNVPSGHLPVASGHSSGSTGAPITYLTTAVTRFFWQVFNLRDQLWHGRDLGLKLVAIRPDQGVRDDRGVTLPGWGPSIAAVYRHGPSALLHSANTMDRQVEWLVGENPDYLLTLASNLLELAREMHRRGIRLARLREARTFGDALSSQARAECRALLGVKVVDMYTAQEAGYIALQCPDHDHYHVQSEGVIVEILDASGLPCAPGAFGKVVLTTLHNYAMPLIRYEIGDYAEAGAPCACGRGLPVVRRILGRERNLALTPDGRKYHPSFAAETWMHIAPVRQLQLVQKTRQRIEARIAAERPITTPEERALAAALRQSLGHPYEITFEYLERIPRAASGKYEDFICEAETQRDPGAGAPG